jgi:hypothetical protein
MWIRKRPVDSESAAVPTAAPAEAPARPLHDAVRQARIEMAEQSGVVVDLRDAEVARLELLNEALDPVFEEIPSEIDMFDRGISRGDNPRLWIDMVAHVHMGRDKRRYRFVRDTRYGRMVLADSNDIRDMAGAITHYVATRLVERERALDDAPGPAGERMRLDLGSVRRRRRWRTVRTFAVGLILGFAAVLAVLWLAASAVH